MRINQEGKTELLKSFLVGDDVIILVFSLHFESERERREKKTGERESRRFVVAIAGIGR